MKTTTWKFFKWVLNPKAFGLNRAVIPAVMLAAANASATFVTTLGGGPNLTNTHYYGFTDGNTVQSSQFNFPCGISTDPSATLLFVADYTNNAVRMIQLDGTAATGTTSTFAKNSDGVNRPVSVLVDGNTNIFVLNRGNGTNGNIMEFSGLYAKFGVPPIFVSTNAMHLTNATAMAMDGLTNIYVTVRSNMVVKVTPFGVVSTVGVITNALTSLRGIAILDNGLLALTDGGNHGIWVMNPLNTSLSNNAVKLTGFHGPGDTNGPPIFAAFNRPEMISKAGNNVLVVADRGNNKVKLVDANNGTVTRLYGVSSNIWIQGKAKDGIYPGWWDGTVDPNVNDAGSVEAREPLGVFVAQDGSVYTTEVYYDIIRQTTGAGLVSPGGLVTPPLFNSPRGIALDTSDSFLYIADQGNNLIQTLSLIDNTTTPFLNPLDGINRPSAVAVDGFDDVFVLNQGTGGNGNILEFDAFGNFRGTNAWGLSSPTAIAIDFAGNFYVTELNGVVQEFSSGSSNTLVTITNAGVQLQGIALFDDGTVAVSDSGNHVIWQVNPITHVYSVLTGSNGVAGNTLGSVTFARLNQPMQLAKALGNQLVVADSGNNRLAVVTRSGSVTNILKSTNSVVWFGRTGDPYGTNSSKWISMSVPVGVAIGVGGDVFDSEITGSNIRKLLTTGISQPPAPVPAPAPQIGWVDFQPPTSPSTLLVPGTSFVFNNDVVIAIKGTSSQIYFTFGPTALQANIPDPNATNGSTPPAYEDGLLSLPPSLLPPMPDVTIKAVGSNPGSPLSAVAQAEFQFIAANPIILGDNAAFFEVTNVTVGSEMWYTTDGTDPTNAGPSSGPLSTSAFLSLDASITNVTLKIRAFKKNYQPSTIVTKTFFASDFVPNKITFGFSSGEASSAFIASAGQFFYAPVTLLTSSGQKVYSLQFNLTVTNVDAAPIVPPVFGFRSFLEKPIPGEPGVFETIPPAMFLTYTTNSVVVTNVIGTNIVVGVTNVISLPGNPPPTNQVFLYDSQPFLDLVFLNSSLNLLGVGWLERAGAKNLYDTTLQDLITFSQAHDTLFAGADNKVILAGYAFQVPVSAAAGDQYQIQIGRPSATSDGIGAPGSSVYIETPTNGSLTVGDVNSIKLVTVGQIKYVVGDCYPFRWFNAGDFGNTNLENADVEQVFQSAVYKLNMPPDGSDFFDSMDSCGFTGTDFGNGYLEADTQITGAGLNPLFDGDDTLINDMAFGDGQLDVCDVYVTFRRSLDPSLTWFRRFWTNGVLGAETTGNTFHPLTIKKTSLNQTVSMTNEPSVNFVAGAVVGSSGQAVQIPITAQVFGSYPLRVLMLNLTVVPLDGSPAITTQVQFSPNTALGAPSFTDSSSSNNYAAVWLNSAIVGLTNNATIGTLTVTIPAGASSTAAYAIHFDHASGSPNGLASFPETTLTGLITTSTRTNSSYSDGIPDAWRLRYFGTVNNALSQASADADGDGMSNMQEYLAGTDPLNGASNLRLGNNQRESIQNGDCVVHWPSVLGKQYLVQRTTDLFSGPWSSVSTNTGTGGEIQIHDCTGGNTRYYRVRVLP